MRPPAAPRHGAALVVALMLLQGCDYEPPWPPGGRIYEMTEAGVVESVEAATGEWRVTLASGAELTVGTASLYEGGIQPGDLLVLATSPEAEGAPATLNRYATLRPGMDGYYLSEPARDDGAHILFRSGLRLPKSPEFDPGPIDDGRFPSYREGFCINSAGEVLGYGPACP